MNTERQELLEYIDKKNNTIDTKIVFDIIYGIIQKFAYEVLDDTINYLMQQVVNDVFHRLEQQKQKVLYAVDNGIIVGAIVSFPGERSVKVSWVREDGRTIE